MASETAKPHSRLGPNSQAESFKSLDGRGIVARRMKAIRHELAEALGGADALSPQQKILIDTIAVRVIRTKLLTAAMLGGDGTRYLGLAIPAKSFLQYFPSALGQKQT